MSRDFTPRYYAIEQHLREVIARSRPGDGLPSEAELCDRFDVSRMTVRHAMQRLVHAGLVYRVSGSGSFVANAPLHRQATELQSFSAQMRRRGLEPSSTILAFEEREPTIAETATLELTAPATVVELHRVRLADDEPVAHERAVFPPRCRGLLDEDVANVSLHALLRKHGHRPVRGRATLAAVRATEQDVALLQVEPGASILVESRVIVDPHDRPLESTESRYSGERYVLDVVFDVEDAT